jgi:predicted negative regulator of RcsB-dependent stress response
MANHLDLEEQEQLDQIKHFWKQYGNPITWVLIAVLGSIAAWNGYQFWQRNQAAQAAAMFDEVEKMVRAGEIQKTERAFGDMKERFASTTYAQQAGLLVAKASYEAGNIEAAKAVLTWVSEKSGDKGYSSIARLRLSSMLLEAKAYDDALRTISGDLPEEFNGLALDRQGDIYAVQDKKVEAKSAYQKAFLAFDEHSEYRRLVEVKLNALGASMEPVAGVALGNSPKPESAK